MNAAFEIEKKVGEGLVGPVTRSFAEVLYAGGPRLDDFPGLISAVAHVKEACAAANAREGLIDASAAAAIAGAAREAAGGKLRGSFPVGILRGFGKPVAANISETIALRASELAGREITPSEVDMSQGVMDVMATAREIVVREALTKTSLALVPLEEELRRLAEKYAGIARTARIGMRDGLPVDFGDVFRAYAAGIRRARRRLAAEAEGWTLSLLGAGDFGTGLAAAAGFAGAANALLSERLGWRVASPEETLDAMDSQDRLVAAHGALEAAAAKLWRIARDLEVSSSGPRAGIRETALPAVAPGSSIMPGKINPTVAQLAELVADQVFSNRAALASAALSGCLEASGTGGTAVKCVMESADLLSRTAGVFRAKVLSGLTVFPERCRTLAADSPALALAIGIAKGSGAMKRAAARTASSGLNLREAAVLEGVLSEKEAEEILDPGMLADPERSAALFGAGRRTAA